MANIQSQFRAKIGEVAYTSNQVAYMLAKMKLGWYAGNRSSKIKDYVKAHDLFVDMQAEGITPSRRSRTQYWIPKSNLVKIIEGMEIPASERDFEDAAYELNYQL
jgi:pentatricopeptide repeat protein